MRRPLAFHLLAEDETMPEVPGRRAKTACGEPFSKGQYSKGDTFESLRRIGGIEVLPERRFEPTKYACKKCVKVWARE